MKIVVLATDADFETIRSSHPAVDWARADDAASFERYTDADAFFDLSQQAAVNIYPAVNKPLFINSVTDILPPEKKAVRINGWKGFLDNSTWEVAGHIEAAEKKVLEHLQKKIIICADEPGFISARIIAMIINEAYFAMGEGVSTAPEIDIAMKSGTNYPYGPFEWADKIGIQQIYYLLKTLSVQDSRYTPSPLLTKTSGN